MRWRSVSRTLIVTFKNYFEIRTLWLLDPRTWSRWYIPRQLVESAASQSLWQPRGDLFCWSVDSCDFCCSQYHLRKFAVLWLDTIPFQKSSCIQSTTSMINHSIRECLITEQESFRSRRCLNNCFLITAVCRITPSPQNITSTATTDGRMGEAWPRR